jgi:type IV secretion system protein VirB4
MRLADILKDKFDMALSMPVPSGARLDAAELAVSDMLPYTVHYDDDTVITKDDALVQVIKLDGLYYESLTAEQIKQFERRRNTVLRAIAHSDRGVYVHLVRRKMDDYPPGDGGTWFAQQFNRRWRQHYQRRSFYINDIYISIVRNRFRQGVPGWLDQAFALLFRQQVTPDELESFDQQAKDIYEASNLVLQTLAAYGARRLCLQRLPVFETEHVTKGVARAAIARFQLSWHQFIGLHGNAATYASDTVRDYLGAEFSEIGGFFHYLVNLEYERVPASDCTLDQMLATARLNFPTKSRMPMVGDTMEVVGLDYRRAGAMLSMQEWPARSSSSMMDELLKLPVEFVITQSFFFVDRISAEHEMKEHQRRMEVNRDIAADQVEDIKEGLKELGAGRSVNGLHHLTILVHVNAATIVTLDNRRQALAELDAAVSLVKKAFVNLGVKAVREFFALETFFWSQLPGQSQKYIGRRGRIKSANFAGFASLHNFAIGKIDGNLWGPAIMPFETESGTAYYFNFHREMEGMVAGHTAFAADTGAGKTTLLSAMMAAADKALPRVYWFDNREGARVFIEAMGGQWTCLTAQGETGWNPLQLPDTPENRVYLVEWLSMLRTCYGGQLTPNDVERFHKLVTENYAFNDSADRRLQNLSWCFGKGSILEREMRVWYGDGANARAFDNAQDCFDLTMYRHYCFEMRQLIKDGVARPELPVIMSYPFHRIEQAMNGEPFIIVLEEGQNLVKHVFWRDKIDSYIAQIRRKNGLLIFVTPDAKYLYSETDSIQKQTATKIFLPNGEASHADYVDALGLTEAEYAFVRDTPVEARKFLIRRGNESIKAVFDLSGMPEFIPVLSSNDKGVALMQAIRQEIGTSDPAQWVPVFMARAIAGNTHNLKH